MMSEYLVAAEVNIVAQCGATFSLPFQWEVDGAIQDIDDGYTAKLVVGKNGDNYFTLDGSISDKTVTFSMTPAQTLEKTPGHYNFQMDLTHTATSDVFRLFYGEFILTKDIPNE